MQPEQSCQWWYWSGRLRTASGHGYGFQAAFFAAEAVRGVLWGQLAHWALVDLDSGEFRSDSRVWLGAPRRIEGRFLLQTPGSPTVASAVGGDGDDRVCLRLGDVSLDLRARGGPVALHYDGRSHDYAFGGSSYYYSRPRMAATGELRRGSLREAVSGDVWFDRQYGELTGALAEGWQWLSIHLDHGEQLMVFGWNREATERFAAVTDAAGRTRWLGSHEVRLEPLARWRSPRSGIDYPCAWRLHTDAHALEVRASTHDQEMNGAGWLGPVYWEGACEVSGSHRGVAYVELLGSLAPWLSSWAEPRREHGPLRRAVARALRHPAVALGLATGVGRLAGAIPGLRPRFAALPSTTPQARTATSGAFEVLCLASHHTRRAPATPTHQERLQCTTHHGLAT